MADRGERVRVRATRQISDDISEGSEESEQSSQGSEDIEGEDFDPRRADAMRRAGRQQNASPKSERVLSGSSSNGKSRATVSRVAINSPEPQRQSLKLTVKAPPSKLREVMRANEVDSLQDTLGGGQVIDGPRSRRSAPPPRASTRQPDRPRYAELGESDVEDEDAAGSEDVNSMDELGEAEGGTDSDVEMDDAPDPPKAPKITLKPPHKTETKPLPNPKLIVTPAKVGPVKSVEDQEMQDQPDDEEVDDSSEESDDDEEDEEDEDGDQPKPTVEGGLEEDALGEDEELDEASDSGSSSESDSDEDPEEGTPDPTKLTKRQMRRAEDENGLMALDMAPQQRKFFTDAEKAMKKDEHARKRKELTKRKIQEEKAAALNRLLKPQASKTRGAVLKPENLAKLEREAAGDTSAEEEEWFEKPDPLYTRWISTKDGVKLGVPAEWLGKRVGRVFGSPFAPSNGRMVQELD